MSRFIVSTALNAIYNTDARFATLIDLALYAAGFPDSMSMELHSRSSIRDSTFFFRIKRRDSEDMSTVPEQKARQASGAQASMSGRHYHNQRQPYLYG